MIKTAFDPAKNHGPEADQRQSRALTQATSRKALQRVVKDPITSERIYDCEESEFLKACDTYRSKYQIKFMNACDYLKVVKALGYLKFAKESDYPKSMGELKPQPLARGASTRGTR